MSEGELAPGLYIVSTPIGNVDDLSPRARFCLERADLIAAEDTRITRTLLRRLGILQSIVSYHDHNESARVPQLIERLVAGGRVALVSDAGTPLLADPGYRLVRAADEAGVRVVPVPGPSASLAALVASGLPMDRFTVIGFLPRRAGRRREAIEELRGERGTIVLFEAPHRLVDTLRDLADLLGERRAALARSLSKADEEILRGTLPELHARMEREERVYGELTLVIEGGPGEQPGELVDRAIARLLAEGLSVRQVRDVVVDVFDLPRSEAYDRVLARKKEK